MYYTYVLKSEKDNKLYVGYTQNIEDRLDKHNKGLIESTKNRRPFRLVYYEACLEQRDAIAREEQLKTGFGRAYLKRGISELKKRIV